MYTIGTCSKCGGDIQVPSHWFGTAPPEQRCSRCGSVAANAYGPVIPMREHKQSVEDCLLMGKGIMQGNKHMNYQDFYVCKDTNKT